MEQFDLVPASVFNNKSFNTQTVTKQELPKYQKEKNHTCKSGSRKKEINKGLLAEADSLVDKFLFCSLTTL